MSIWSDLFGSGTENVTTTTNTASSIPGQDAAVQDAINEASRLYNKGPAQYYGGQTVADFSDDSLNAMDMIRKRATVGSPLLQAAQDENLKTVQGDYLAGNNPYLDQAIQGGFDKARTGIDAQFQAGGRYGSGLHKQGLGESFGNIAANTYAKAYENERDRQITAQNFAPSLAQADYADAAQLANVGATQENLSQDMINADLARWNYEKNEPQNMLNNYMNLIGGNYGTTATNVQPMFRNNTANTLGSALQGANLAKMLGGGGGWQTLGAIGGGLLG